MGSLVLLATVVMVAAMALLWVVQYLFHDAGIVDVAWAAGLGVLATLYAVLGEGVHGRQTVVAALAAAWALRLALHLFTDRILGKPEDGRYQMMRNRMGDKVQPFFFGFYMLQAGFAVLFSLPMLVATTNPAPFPHACDIAAIVVWFVAVVGEAVADAQLARFRGDGANKGTTCKLGLWRYSRHPNYFFEWLHWWAYVLLAWGAGGWWWMALLAGPVMMFAFLWFVTGVPYTEMQALRTRNDYAEYQRTTSPFVPWFPRKPEPHA